MWVIECPARCAERGCTDHLIGSWRESRSLPSTLSEAEAEQELIEHAEKFPKSGPYRLVRRD